MCSKESIEKLKYIFIVAISTIIFLICVKYLLPLLLPFIAGYACSKIILPLVNFLCNKLHFHRTTASIIVLTLFLSILLAALYLLISTLTSQLSAFVKDYGIYEALIEKFARNCCNIIGEFTGINSTIIYTNLNSRVNDALVVIESKIMPTIMNFSIATIRGIFGTFIFLLTTVISTFFFTRDQKIIATYIKNCRFHKEISFFTSISHNVIYAYIKSQLIIMSLISFICTIGFVIIKNPYSILYGIIIGILDILPLIGAGTFLVPMSIYYCFLGNYKTTAILFALFILCYCVREILEPKLMSNSIGIHPLISLISIFIGYQFFGILGMILGPFGYVFISETSKKILPPNAKQS